MVINREDKLQLLKKASEILKEEFVGLDAIIDQLIDSVSPWYVTPEIITRPVIISVWGMTGTGKTSVVRRLIELLEIKQDSMFFDCGRCTSDRTDIISDIEDTFGSNPEELECSAGSVEIKGGNPVLIFDEFQYARTLDEEHKEVTNASIRPIWELLDSGIVNITDKFDWIFTRLCEFVEDLDDFSTRHPEIKLVKGKVVDPDDVKVVLENLGFIWYDDRDLPLESEKKHDPEEEDPYRPLSILRSDLLRAVVKRSSKRGQDEGKQILESIRSATNVRELYEILFKETITDRGGKYLDCTKALIFVVGNLDEAFYISDDLNPDMDPDIFYDISKKVSVSDIKEALLKRFRPEQVARLGNNLIKYPTLQKKDFIKIIDKELTRVIDRFREVIPDIKVTYTTNLQDLIYYEGVYPTQGVRPLFSSINMFLAPYLSKIVTERKDTDKEVVIDIENFTNGFRNSSVTLLLHFKSDSKKVSNRRLRYPILLQLGEIRDVAKRKKRYISAVHEAGHAVVFAWRTGYAPVNIVAVSTDKGGFCSTYIKDLEGEIKSRHELDSEVMISIAGYLAEEEIYKDRLDMTLLGSSSDLSEMWESFTSYCYNTGYFEPLPFANRETESNIPIPSGLDSGQTATKYVRYFNGESFVGDELFPMTLEEAVKKRLEDLTEDTKVIIQSETRLIKKLALVLGEKGSIGPDEFLDYVEKYGTILHKEMMESVKRENSCDIYKEILERDDIEENSSSDEYLSF